MAVSPSLWLLPSNLIILKYSIVAYNNNLKIATNDMNFGLNSNLDYDNNIINNKRIHNTEALQLENLDKNKITKKKVENVEAVNTKNVKTVDNHNKDIVLLFGLTTLSSYAFFKYII